MAWGHNQVTDGSFNMNDYTWQMTYDAPQYVEIDLGEVYNDLKEIKIWHYPDGRIFSKTKTQISADGINWITVFDSAESGTYVETMDGLPINLNYLNKVIDVPKEPIVTSISIDKPIISDEVGFDKGIITFTFDQDVTAYSVRCNGVSFDTGIYVEEYLSQDLTVLSLSKQTVGELSQSTINSMDFGNTIFPKSAPITAEVDYTELYQEGENRINIYGKSTDGIWSNYDQKDELFVRYIKSNIYRSQDGKGQWAEIKAFSSNSHTNVALGKEIIPYVNMNPNNPLSVVTDDSTSSGYAESLTYGAIEVDLGELFKLSEIQVNHYWDGRIYGHTLSVSSDRKNWIELWNTEIDGEYSSTQDGKLINVPQYIKPYDKFSVRYIRNNIYQSIDGKGQWSEIRAFSNGVNVALNKTVTSSLSVNKPLTIITDGNDGNTSSEFVESTTYGSVEIDLEQVYQLEEIQVCHYWDGRVYGHILSISSDGENWIELWNTEINGEYSSTHTGKLINVPQNI